MKTLNSTIALIGLCAMSFSAPRASAATIYAVRDVDDHLIGIDNVTLAVTDVGPLGVSFEFGGLGYDSRTDTLYMIGGTNPALYRVNRTTGAATLIGNHGLPRLFGLEFDSKNGVLYASQFGSVSDLYTLNTSTGVATRVGDIGSPGVGGLAYDPFSDTLVGVEPNIAGGGKLYAINRSTGAKTLLASGPAISDSGLAYDTQRRVFWDIDESGNLYSFDPANGYARTTWLSGLGACDGLAFVIPEPAAATLLLCGVLVSGRCGRRRAV